MKALGGLATREIETRTTRMPVEVRSAAGARRTIGGYAAVFGKPSRPLGAFVEVVEHRAFDKSRADGWALAVCRFEHRSDMLLGTIAAGTLELRLDATGLDYAVAVPESRSDVLELVQRRDVTSSSFSFQCYSDSFSYGGGDLPVHHLNSVRVIDVAPTSVAAYPDASVALRSMASHVGADPDDVFELARQHELRTLFTRTDLAVAAPVTVEPAVPTPLAVAERRSGADDLAARRRKLEDDGGLEARLRMSELQRKKMLAEETPRQRAARELRERTGDLDLRMARLRFMEHEPPETRSLATDFPRDCNGHAYDWHPSHQ